MGSLRVGDVLTAAVVRVAPFGVFLEHEGPPILVRITDLSFGPIRDLQKFTKPGDPLKVKVIDVSSKEIVASALPFLDNPFADRSRYGVGSTLRARVVEEASTSWKRGEAWRPGDPVCDFPEAPHREHVGFIVEIDLGLRFTLPDSAFSRPPRLGEELDIVVTAVDSCGRPTQVGRP